MDFQQILYAVDGPIGVITMNRPERRNAQGYRMLDELDRAFDLARRDEAVRVVLLRGSHGVFSTGHDLGTPEETEYRKSLGAKPGIQTYDQFKHYNLDLLVRWRNFPKPTVAMVEGYCIYAGWMLAAAMDVVFAADNAEFLAGFVEYMSIPWDIGVRRAKELCFESRFITAREAADYGLVNRVLAPADLQRETFAWARRVAENTPETLRLGKIQMNKAQDAQGFTQALEDSLGDYQAMLHMPGLIHQMQDTRRLHTVDLAVRGKRGERYGLTPTPAPQPPRKAPEMSDEFRALRVFKTEAGQETRVVTLTAADLMDGDVDVRIDYSTLNYKDGLALTGRAPIVRAWPLTPGIDFAGVVERSDHPHFQPGDRVVLNGWGVGETHHGGYAQKARVKGDWLVRLPETLTTAQAMAIGTAGYTAMLSVMALEREGITPDRGDILVTGAAGGVGSVAIALLARLGYRVVASTGRKESEADYLTGLGASEVIDRATLSAPGRPLGKERWAGAVDSVGSHTLVNVIAQTRYGGVVAACGLAQGLDLPGSVAPFILRGITLTGIDSVMCPSPRRAEAWRRLAADLDLARLEAMTRVVGLEEIPDLAEAILAGQVRGRVVVDVNR